MSDYQLQAEQEMWDAIAQQERESAKAAEQKRAESIERSDTDGFVSQWAHGVMAQKHNLAAQIAEQGGTWTFQGLFDRETGERVKAKIVRVEDRYSYGRRVSKWIVLDERDNAVHWIPAYKSGKNSKLYKLGFEERDEVAPAVADLSGSGRGLSGATSVSAYARRTDGGYPEGARTLKQIRG